MWCGGTTGRGGGKGRAGGQEGGGSEGHPAHVMSSHFTHEWGQGRHYTSSYTFTCSRVSRAWGWWDDGLGGKEQRLCACALRESRSGTTTHTPHPHPTHTPRADAHDGTHSCSSLLPLFSLHVGGAPKRHALAQTPNSPSATVASPSSPWWTPSSGRIREEGRKGGEEGGT